MTCRARRREETNRPSDYGDVETKAGERQRGHAAHAAAFPRARLMGHVMQHAALGGEAIFGPDPLDVDERGLAQAVDGVLKRGNGDGVIGVRGRDHVVTTRL